MNIMSAAADASTISLAEVAMAFARGGSAAGLFNQNMEDTATAIAILGKAGIKGEEAGTMIKTVLSRLASGAAAMRALLDRDPALDAVFVASDLMAAGAISVLRDRGLAVPGDVAVVGFDDSSAAKSGEIPLTTVHQPSREMGVEMARMLLALLRGETTERERVMPTRMVVRASA